MEQETTGVVEAIQAEIDQLKPDRVKEALESLTPHLIKLAWNLAFAIVIWFVGRKIISLILGLLKRTLKKSPIEPSVERFLAALVNALLHGILVFMIVDKVGIPTTSLLALLGSTGLAVGLALQGSLSNFAGGILILLLRPFKVGDYIIEDGHRNEGTVHEIGLFYTTLITSDNKRIVLPNGTLANNSLTNVNGCERRRMDIAVSISYDSDLKRAKEILLEILEKQEEKLKEERGVQVAALEADAEKSGVSVYVADLSAGAVELAGRIWLPSSELFRVKCDVMEEVKYAFDAEGIQVFYPKLDICMSKDPDNG